MEVKERLHSCTWVVRKDLINKVVLEQRVKGLEELVLQTPEARALRVEGTVNAKVLGWSGVLGY